MANPLIVGWLFYLTCKVESGGKWDSINYNDPITVGAAQWFGTRAAKLLNEPEIKSQWGSYNAGIRGALETKSAGDGSYWPNRYLSPDEGESLRPSLASDGGKTAQVRTFTSDYDDMLGALAPHGVTESNPKTLILLMNAYHQSPRSGLGIARDYGGNSDLDRIYAAIRNNSVLGKYMKWRYDVVYNELKTWNGTDPAPGDFGNITGGGVPGGIDDDAPPPPPGPNQPDNPADTYGIKHIQQVGNDLYVVTKDGRRLFAPSLPGQSWVVRGASGDSGAGGVVPPTPPVPPPATDTPTPPTGTGQWAHPCPGRRAVSSEYKSPDRPDHLGMDFAAAIGTPIYAVEEGTVIKAGSSSGFGFAVGILHPEGIATGYGHMDLPQILVKVGDKVTRGQQIAGVNTKGQSTGPHLHFECYMDGKWAGAKTKNPRTILQEHGVTP